MTNAQKTIRKHMVKWACIGLKAAILSQSTNYAFSTCQREIKRVIAEGLTETNYCGAICIKDIELFKTSYEYH